MDFSFIHSYLTYGSVVLASTNKTKHDNLTKPNLTINKKNVRPIIFFTDKLTHAKPLLEYMNTLNILAVKYISDLIFHAQSQNNETRNIFQNIFSKLKRKYYTRSCEYNFTKPLYRTELVQYIINFRIYVEQSCSNRI